MSDLIIVKVKDGIDVKPDMMRHLRNEIIKQKETGIIVLPWFLTAVVVPEDTEIKMESEEDKESHNDGWCNTCEYKHLESECLGCAKYDEYGNLITLSKYKKESEE